MTDERPQTLNARLAEIDRRLSSIQAELAVEDTESEPAGPPEPSADLPPRVEVAPAPCPDRAEPASANQAEALRGFEQTLSRIRELRQAAARGGEDKERAIADVHRADTNT